MSKVNVKLRKLCSFRIYFFPKTKYRSCGISVTELMASLSIVLDIKLASRCEPMPREFNAKIVLLIPFVNVVFGCKYSVLLKINRMHANASILNISIILFADQTVEVNSFIQTMLHINATFKLVTFIIQNMTKRWFTFNIIIFPSKGFYEM